MEVEPTFETSWFKKIESDNRQSPTAWMLLTQTLNLLLGVLLLLIIAKYRERQTMVGWRAALCMFHQFAWNYESDVA